MNRERAIHILDIDIPSAYNTNNDITEEIIKKHYRIKALQYHPDKNKEPGATDQFVEIKNAYEYLLKHNDNPGIVNDEYSSYNNILQTFLKNIWKGEQNTQLFSIIIENIVSCCENKILGILEKLDNDTLIKIHDVFSKYKHAFHHSDGFLKYLEHVLAKKIKNDNCIILNPSIDDLFDCNLYKITENGYTYIVPLWHHELVYDNSSCDLYVRCNPILAENISIDDENNLHIFAKYSVIDIFDKESIVIDLGTHKFSISVSTLFLKHKQTVMLKGRGIPRICSHDIYNVSYRGDIHIHIELY